MYPMLPVSLDCPFSLSLRYYLTFLLSCVLWILCRQFIWIVMLHYPLGILQHLFVLRLAYPMLQVFLDCPFSIAFLVFSNIYVSYVFCIICCQFLLIFIFTAPLVFSYHIFVLCPVYPMLPVYLDCPFSLPFPYSLTYICPVSYKPYVASLSGLSFFTTPSVSSSIYLSCVLFILCCQFLWIVLFHYSFSVILHLFVLCPVYPMLPVSLDFRFEYAFHIL